jgi:alanine racemase
MKNRLRRLFNPPVEPMNKIYIHSKNILHNFDCLQSLQSKSSIFPVLKSNAYGHWLAQITQILDKINAPYLVVDSFPEYQIVKKHSNKNILILWETLPKNYRKFDFSRATFCVYNIETIRYLTKLNRKIKIHLFLDTGMHREWVSSDELLNILEFLKSEDKSKIQIEWVLSHLHSADEQDQNINNIDTQINLFKKMYHTIIDYGHIPKRKHVWNNAWLFKIKDDFFNAYRPGLSLYGYTSLSENDPDLSLSKELKPALNVESRVVALHAIKSGEWISYNHTRIASEDTNIASIPFWYAEWLPRSVSNKIFFKHKKDYIPQIGSICMNLSSLEVGNDASIWDTVEVMWIEWENSLQKISENSDRILYEILVWLDRNIRREIV